MLNSSLGKKFLKNSNKLGMVAATSYFPCNFTRKSLELLRNWHHIALISNPSFVV
jgi:hypothetical protein